MTEGGRARRYALEFGKVKLEKKQKGIPQRQTFSLEARKMVRMPLTKSTLWESRNFPWYDLQKELGKMLMRNWVDGLCRPGNATFSG